MRRGFGQLLILLIILIIVGVGVWAVKTHNFAQYFNANQNPIVQPTSAPTAESDMTNWKTYTNPQKTFTLMLPPKWEQTSTLSDPNYRKFFFGGPEGTLQVMYGSGFGGGCLNWSKIKIKSQEINACYSTEVDDSESIGASTIYKEQSFSFSAKVNAPYLQNEKLVKDILSTAELIGTEQF